MEYTLSVKAGRLELGNMDEVRSFEDSFRRAVRIEDHATRLNAVSQVVMPLIRFTAPYLEWTNMFYAPRTEGPNDHVRIPKDTYTVVAFMSSPDGGIEYTRPHRKYATVSWRQVRCGLQIPWDADSWGWDVIGTKMMEAAEELARKRDDLRKPLLDAAAISQAGHIPEVASSLTKASVDSIIKSSAQAGFPVTMAALNISEMMDMAGWVLPSNSLFGSAIPQNVGSEVLTKLYFNGYGGLTWIANHTIPTGYVYFSGPASDVGWRFEGGVRRASEPDIDHDLDKHNWRQDIAAHLEGTHRVWRLQIT